MTTIIVIVVVALVFFVTVCVATFMVWKKETEMRTDSIRAIESNLERLGERIASGADGPAEELRQHCEQAAEATREISRGRPGAVSAADPFSWTREAAGDEPAVEERTVQEETVQATEDTEQVCSNHSNEDKAAAPEHVTDDEYPEISLDFSEVEDAFAEEENTDFNTPGDVTGREDPSDKNTCGYDVGRSGRKYTAEELEMLIKE